MRWIALITTLSCLLAVAPAAVAGADRPGSELSQATTAAPAGDRGGSVLSKVDTSATLDMAAGAVTPSSARDTRAIARALPHPRVHWRNEH